MSVELAFVLAPRQNLFFVELVDALCEEIRALGARASKHVGDFPPPRPDLVYVLVPPHEYFTIMHGRRGPMPDVYERTIYICTEQPDTPFFEDNVALAPRAGAIFDINSYSVRTFRGRGIAAEHLQIGWTAGWDHGTDSPSPERDIDVLFMGCNSEWRSAALARCARMLVHRRTLFVLSDNSRPNWRQSGGFTIDEHKWDLFRRARVLLNVHQGSSPYFEWLRMVQAMSNGSVVVSEHSADCEPLVPGRHFLSGSIESLGPLCELVLSDQALESELRETAYQTIRADIPLSHGAGRLISAASRLAAETAVPDPDDPFFTQVPDIPDLLGIFTEQQRPHSELSFDAHGLALRRAIKAVQLDLLDVRRQLSRRDLDPGRGRLEVVHRTAAHSLIRPRVSVLMALYNYERHVVAALDSLEATQDVMWEVIIVDDGSTDDSCAVARDWLRHHEHLAGILLQHPVNQGLAASRNDALGFARGEFCFVLDADNELYSDGLVRLTAALDADPEAVFAYGMHERFQGQVSLGLANVLPWEPERLRAGNYIDAMALIRTSALRDRFGGFVTDPRLYGWEDYALWCNVAEQGLRATFVPEVVARYRVASHSMLSLTNISSADAFSVLIDRYPALMAGMQPPLG